MIYTDFKIIYRRINDRFKAETILRHETRLMRAVAARVDAARSRGNRNRPLKDRFPRM